MARTDQALAAPFYGRIRTILQNSTGSEASQIIALRNVLKLFFEALTRHERLNFNTLFARMAYAGSQYKLPSDLLFYLHRFRRYATGTAHNERPLSEKKVVELGAKALAEMVQAVWEEPIPDKLALLLAQEWPLAVKSARMAAFQRQVRALIIAFDEERDQLVVHSEERPGEVIRVQYNETGKNENFQPTIALIKAHFTLPLTVNLVDVQIDEEGIYHPAAFVVEPDYLVDVTAVAESYGQGGVEPTLHLMKKYLPRRNAAALTIGNIANFFLDELLTNPDQSFKDVFGQAFRLDPLGFCLFTDAELRDIMMRCKNHFDHLKYVVTHDFIEADIDASNCYLEPSFYSERYGLQGRLDVLHQGENSTDIIELKSGKVFKPNAYGININHFTQTLLYDLLIRSVFGSQSNPTAFILYSAQADTKLRHAPAVRAAQYEALQVRNFLIAGEQKLQKLAGDNLLAVGQELYGGLHPSRFDHVSSFAQRDLTTFAKVWSELEPIERRYFIAYSGFIAREHSLAKIGRQGTSQSKGQASLWLDSYAEKSENYQILRQLKLIANLSAEDDPLLIFERPNRRDKDVLVNFRVGDIVVLYPSSGQEPDVLRQQVFKCTIIELSPTQLHLRLRARQRNGQLFESYEHWHIESDLLDSSFLSQYRGLFAFAAAPADRRSLWLGKRAPAVSEKTLVEAPLSLTDEQQSIFQKIVAAEEYFLLWGPPGTGKTSMMLKHLVGYLLQNTGEELLLLAYTNRAVDEICAALDALGGDIRDHYLRIGSRYSTGEIYRNQLLSHQIQGLTRRDELKSLLKNRRIIVGTVSSVSGKHELFQLKNFDRLIIDEASQILEPLLMGLVPRVQRVVLIGDHRQLPAVVTQPSSDSRITDKHLIQIGFTDLGTSLFERIYLQAKEKAWTHAYAQLSQQGRMHVEIMEFPSQSFYKATLRILPENIGAHRRQLQVLPYVAHAADKPIENLLATRRVIFFPTKSDPTSANQKTNLYEAAKIADLVEAFLRLYQIQKKEITSDSIGIITPYRAQIACIRQELTGRGLPIEPLTIDTVERYQGGARDVILISLCTNAVHQLERLISPSIDGFDRKLNVALTRAREHLIVLGNKDVLMRDETYAKFVEKYQAE